MVSFPPCKINLGLHIVSLRPDGYHDIETCFYPISWCDILEIVPSKTSSFTHTGLSVSHKDNMCLRAYQLLKQHFDLPSVAIHLHKIIPIGAGLGGGSSDATYTLKMLDQLFALQISQQDMLDYALQLGSDCACFIYDGPTLGSGRGDVLRFSQIALSGKTVVLIYPCIQVSSAEAYRGVAPRLPSNPLRRIIEQSNIAMWKTTLTNDFEQLIFKQHPVVENIKAQLYDQGALYASMSGSGSAVFGIFDTSVSLAHHFPNMTYWSGQL